MVIHPYRYEGLWVFDDAATQLVREPFVGGMDLILDRITAGIPDAARGFTIVFSAIPFPGHEHVLKWLREEMGGNTYRHVATGMEGWLCPALLKYFDTPPKTIYIQIKHKAASHS
jgi:hypothetical protein